MLQRGAGGGMEVRMVKKLAAAVPESIPPVFLATAIEAAMHAGRVQMARFGGADCASTRRGRSTSSPTSIWRSSATSAR